MVRVLAHDRDRAVKLPDDLVRRLALAGSRGQAVWEVARKNRDWELFRPALEGMVALKREQADLLGHDGEAYDALMDAFEPGMRIARVEPLFASLADELQAPACSRSPSRGPAAAAALRRQGASPTPSSGTSRCACCATSASTSTPAGRTAPPIRSRPAIALARHPADDPPGRAATRSRPISSTHARGRPRPVRAGLRPASTRTRRSPRRPRWACTSRSRACGRTWSAAACPFWEHYTPVMREMFRDALGGVERRRTCYREVNRVQPSLIRVEADEVTYNLHILIRFELELALLRGQPRGGRPARRPGTTPTSAASACARRTTARACCRTSTGRAASFGYFPTYTLGNLYSAMLWERIAADLPDIDGAARRGPSSRRCSAGCGRTSTARATSTRATT